MDDFKVKFSLMKDYPERQTIKDLTEISKRKVMNANLITNFIISKLIDPATNASFKLPMFYLIDSIMKVVGGPYGLLFSKLLDETYTTAIGNLHLKDCDRMKFLLQTWSERKFLGEVLLNKMLISINNRIKSVSYTFILLANC